MEGGQGHTWERLAVPSNRHRLPCPRVAHVGTGPDSCVGQGGGARPVLTLGGTGDPQTDPPSGATVAVSDEAPWGICVPMPRLLCGRGQAIVIKCGAEATVGSEASPFTVPRLFSSDFEENRC